MNNKNNNYRVMKFLEPVNKKDKSKGYVRLDIRGIRGTILVSVENLGDIKSTSEVYLFKDKTNKIKLGNVNNKKGMIKKILTFGNNSVVEDYNICGVVKENKIVLYANLFNAVNPYDIRKLDDSYGEKTQDVIETEPQQNLKNVQSVENLSNESEEKEMIKEEKLEEMIKEEKQEEAIKTVKKEEIKKETKEDITEEIYEDSIEQGNKNDSNSYEFKDEEIPENNDIDNPEIDDNYKAEDKKDEKIELAEEKESIQADVEAAARRPSYRNKTEESLYNILRDYHKLEPLSVKIKDLSWWKVPYDDRGLRNGYLPYYNQIISSYYPYPMSSRVTTCNSLMKKYGHYIFGIFKEKDNIKKYVYGVPGEFKREEQPYKGVTGFKNWSYKNKSIEGEYGYWLAFVDSFTGEVTDPPQIVLAK